MASAYSVQKEYQPYIEQWNTELLGTALLAKQAAYNDNRAKVQSFYNMYSNIDFVKDEDKAYFNERITALRQQVEQNGMGDLSQAGVAENLASYLGQASDDKVLNGIEGTKYKEYYDAQHAQLKKDGKFSQQNYEYGLQNFVNWANDGTAGTSLNDYKNNWEGAGIGQAYEYFDKQQHIIDVFKEHRPDITVVQTKQGVQYLNFKKEQMTAEEVNNILETFVYSDPRFQQQMKIDAWATYGSVPNEIMSSSIKTTIEGKKNNLEQILEKTENSLLKAKGAEKEQLTAYKSQLEQAIGNYKTDLNNWDNQYSKNPEYYKQQVYKENFSANIRSIYEKDNIIDISSITDHAALESLKHSYALDTMSKKAQLDAQNTKLMEGQKLMAAQIAAGKPTDELATYLDNIGIPTGVAYQDANGQIVNATWKQLDAQKALGQLGTKTGEETLGDIAKEDAVTSFKNKKEKYNTESASKIASLSKNLGITLPSNIEDLDITALTKQVNNLNVGEATKAELKKDLKALGNAQIELERLDMQETNAIQNAIESLPVNQVIKAKDGRQYYKDENGVLYKADRATVGEGLTTFGKAVIKDPIEGIINTYRTAVKNVEWQINLTPKKGQSGIELEQALKTDWNRVAGNATTMEEKQEIQKIKKILGGKRTLDDLSFDEANKVLELTQNLEDIRAYAQDYDITFNQTNINKGLFTPITKQDLAVELTNDLRNGSLAKDSEEILNTVFSVYQDSPSDIRFNKSVIVTNTTDRELQTTLNTALGENIDWSKKDTYKDVTYNVDDVLGKVEFSAKIKNGDEFVTVTGNLAVDQAMQQSRLIAETVNMNRAQNTVDYNNAVIKKEIKAMEEMGSTRGAPVLKYQNKDTGEVVNVAIKNTPNGNPDLLFSGDSKELSDISKAYADYLGGYIFTDHSQKVFNLQEFMRAYLAPQEKGSWEVVDTDLSNRLLLNQ